MTITAPAGLEGVVVAETAVGDVLGHEGFYHYRGHPAPDLARERTLEEVWHLLHVGHLPDAAELANFRARVGALRALPADLGSALGPIARSGPPMAALRTALSLAGGAARPWLDLAPGELEDEALALAAQAPVLVGALWRARQGLPPVAPDPTLDVAADYLRAITGEAPDPAAAAALTRYLILTIDHGFNASTFAARVVASTGADLTSAIVAGMGALSGPLHGGAPGRVLEMLEEIGSADRAAAYVEEALAARRRIMGFGHRVYRTEDPRSVVMKETALALGGPLVELAVEVEAVVLDLLERRYPERDLRTNVEYYAGVVLHRIGMPAELFSPSFAVSRILGWNAHVVEQTRANRIIRPASRYVEA